MEEQIHVTSFEKLTEHILARARTQDVFVVGICGFAGSGKSTLCKRLACLLPATMHHFECDRFSRHSFREREQLIARSSGQDDRLNSEENPMNWYPWTDIEAALRDLRTCGAFTYERAWNSKTGELTGKYELTLREDSPAVILCDCIFLLHSPVRSCLDLTVLVETPQALRQKRGRQRTESVERHAYMQRLEQEFVNPYFRANSEAAHMIYTTGD